MISQVNMRVATTFGEEVESREIWFLFESDHETLFELNEDLAIDGTAYGFRIDSASAGNGYRRETGRSEMILGTESLISVTLPRYDLLPVEKAEKA